MTAGLLHRLLSSQTPQAGCRGAARHLLAWLLLSAALPAAAQEAALWELEPGDASVRLDPAVLSELQAGARVALPLPGERLQARLDGAQYLPGGDLSWQGAVLTDGMAPNAELHVLVLTVGETALFGTVSSPAGLWQLRAARQPDGAYLGTLERAVTGRELNDDHVELPPVPGTAPVSGEGFTLRQEAWPRRVRVGEPLQIEVAVRSEVARPRESAQAWVYFLLDATTLLDAPTNCQVVSDEEGGPVLGCRLDGFAAGEEKRLAIRVQVEERSHPLVYSTVLLGDLRHDLTVEIYRDVLSDSDGDGVSDHAERLLGSDPLDAGSVLGREPSVIDVLGLLAEGVDAHYGGAAATRLNQLVSVANRIFADSGVAIRLRLAELVESGYPASASLATDLEALTWQEHPAFAELGRRRRAAGADLVVLLRHSVAGGDGLCGLANLGGQGLEGDLSAPYQKDLAYSVVNLDCLDDSVLAHEIGHNLGLAHSRLESPEGGAFAHGAGHGVPGDFVTVMAYPGDYPGATRVFRFSSPWLDCGLSACGVEASDPLHGADAAAALNAVRHQVAAYYPSLEERLQELPVAGVPGARLLAGASADGGLNFAAGFAPGSTVDVQALLQPAPGHLGRSATLHAVLHIQGEGFFQILDDGSLLPWNDMDLQALLPLGEPLRLADEVRMQPLRGFQGQAGQRIGVYVAYRLDSGELVYSDQPLYVGFGAAAAQTR